VPIVVITGATAGIGRATSWRFAEQGASIALLARGFDGLAATAREVVSRGGRALPIAVDVADAEGLRASAELIESELGPVDIWINNATTTVFGRVAQLSPWEYRRVTDVTYHGVVWGTMAALAVMRPRNRGTIIQISSALAHRAMPLQSAYCGAMHAVRAFTDSLRSELLEEHSSIHLTTVQLPASVPRILQPEIAAEAIYHAATHRRCEIYVGEDASARLPIRARAEIDAADPHDPWPEGDQPSE
jgi:NADP-dependent 3-hydroxy acid dehydrogenase YdfG